MCLGLPARVLGPATESPDLVRVDLAGSAQLVNAALLDEPARPGQWILVHMGFALSTMTEDEAGEALAGLESMAAERAGEDPGGGWR